MNKNKKLRYPSKSEMNLYAPVRDGNSPEIVIPTAIFLAVAIALFTKFCVLDRLAKVNAAEAELSQLQTQLAEIDKSLENYDQVREDYYRYTRAYMTEGDAQTVDRLEIIAMLDRNVPTYADYDTVTITGNSVVLKVYSASLDNVAALQRLLENDKLVDSVTVYNADKNYYSEQGTPYVQASLLIRLVQEVAE